MSAARICVIGNSHIASLKGGWNIIGAGKPPRLEITFFGHRANRLDGLEVVDGLLRPDNEDLERSLAFTSGGATSIDPGRYDHILLYGMGALPWILPTDVVYSHEVLKRAAGDLSSDTLSMRTLNKLRRIYDGPVHLGHEPLPALEPVGEGTAAAYVNGMERLNALVYGPINARLWTQPVETIVNGQNTSLSYSAGSKRLAVGANRGDDPHGDDDRIHMNHHFGALWLQAFLEGLGYPG